MIRSSRFSARNVRMFGSRRSAILWISWLSTPFCLRNRYVPGVANSSTLSFDNFWRAGNVFSLSDIFPAETRTFLRVFLPSSFRLKPSISTECSSAIGFLRREERRDTNHGLGVGRGQVKKPGTSRSNRRTINGEPGACAPGCARKGEGQLRAHAHQGLTPPARR